MAAPTYQDFLAATGGSLARPNAMGSVDDLYALQRKKMRPGFAEPTAADFQTGVSATGGIPTMNPPQMTLEQLQQSGSSGGSMSAPGPRPLGTRAPAMTLEDLEKGRLGVPPANGAQVSAEDVLRRSSGAGGSSEFQPTGEEVQMSLSRTGGISTSGRSANDPQRMLEAAGRMARTNPNNPRLKATLSVADRILGAQQFEQERKDAISRQMIADARMSEQRRLGQTLTTHTLEDGTEVTLTGLGGIANVNRPEMDSTPDIVELEFPGLGKRYWDRMNKQWVTNDTQLTEVNLEPGKTYMRPDGDVVRGPDVQKGLRMERDPDTGLAVPMVGNSQVDESNLLREKPGSRGVLRQPQYEQVAPKAPRPDLGDLVYKEEVNANGDTVRVPYRQDPKTGIARRVVFEDDADRVSIEKTKPKPTGNFVEATKNIK